MSVGNLLAMPENVTPMIEVKPMRVVGAKGTSKKVSRLKG